MEIKFDKRFDLILGLMYSVNKDYNCGFKNVASYIPEFEDKFYQLYKQHTNKELDEYIINRGLASFDTTILIVNSLNDKYEVINNYNTEYIHSINNNFNPELLTKLLKEFVERSHYNEFYDNTINIRDKIINNFKNTLNQYIDINQNILADFYGYSIAPQQIILSFFSKGAYGLILDGKQSYVTGLGNYIEGKFDKRIITLLFHEFSHPYINPLGEKYFKGVDIINLFNYAKENGLSSQYNNPITFINEYVVRAIQIINIKDIFNEEDVRDEINAQKVKGYPHIEELLETFKNKENYISFEEFYKNEIVNYIVELNNRVSTMSKTSML